MMCVLVESLEHACWRTRVGHVRYTWRVDVARLWRVESSSRGHMVRGYDFDGEGCVWTGATIKTRCLHRCGELNSVTDE